MTTDNAPSTIRRLRLRAEARIARQVEVIKELQDRCDHQAAVKTYKGNTGNYDPSADSYWIDWDCPHCGKKWTTDQ